MALADLLSGLLAQAESPAVSKAAENKVLNLDIINIPMLKLTHE